MISNYESVLLFSNTNSNFLVQLDLGNYTSQWYIGRTPNYYAETKKISKTTSEVEKKSKANTLATFIQLTSYTPISLDEFTMVHGKNYKVASESVLQTKSTQIMIKESNLTKVRNHHFTASFNLMLTTFSSYYHQPLISCQQLLSQWCEMFPVTR